jgi:hypothetical protein
MSAKNRFFIQKLKEEDKQIVKKGNQKTIVVIFSLNEIKCGNHF